MSFDVAGGKVGVSGSAWFDWEKGNKVPSVDRCEKLEEVTGGAVTVAMWADFSREVRKERGDERAAKKAAGDGTA